MSNKKFFEYVQCQRFWYNIKDIISVEPCDKLFEMSGIQGGQ